MDLLIHVFVKRRILKSRQKIKNKVNKNRTKEVMKANVED